MRLWRDGALSRDSQPKPHNRCFPHHFPLSESTQKTYLMSRYEVSLSEALRLLPS